MPVVMLIAVAAVLICVFLVATGWGGEMSYERPDHAPLDLGPVSATDIALMRPPTALWGYNMQVTEEALELIARAIRDRDITIATLQQQLAELGLDETQAVRAPEPRMAPDATQTAESLPPSEVRLPPYLRPPSDARHHAEPGQPPEPGQQPVPGQLPEPGQRSEAPPAVESFSAAEGPGAVPADESPQPVVTDAAAAAQPTAVTQPTAAAAQPTAAQPTAAAAQPAAAQPTAVTQPVGISPGRSRTPLSAPPVVDVAQPAKAPAPDEPKGPQGTYDAHGWWAEQMRAAREEQGPDDPSCDVDPPEAVLGDAGLGGGHGAASDGLPDDGSLAAAEEQGW